MLACNKPQNTKQEHIHPKRTEYNSKNSTAVENPGQLQQQGAAKPRRSPERTTTRTSTAERVPGTSIQVLRTTHSCSSLQSG